MNEKLYKFLAKGFPEEMKEGMDPVEFAINLICDSYNINRPAEVEETVDNHARRMSFSPSVLYHNGISRTTQTLPIVTGDSYDECRQAAEELANRTIGEKKWSDISMRPVTQA